jgi:hypothetical protein
MQYFWVFIEVLYYHFLGLRELPLGGPTKKMVIESVGNASDIATAESLTSRAISLLAIV